MKSFTARFIVTAIGIPLTFASIFLGDKDFFFAIVAIAVVLMTSEYCEMAGFNDYLKWSSVVTVVAAYAVFYAGMINGYENVIFGLAGVTLVFLAAELNFKRFWVSPENPLRMIFYLGLLTSFVAAVRAIAGEVSVLGFQTGLGSILVFDYLCVVWATDIFAYLIGSRLKTPKLCPDISAGKTIGGSTAGFIAAVLTAAVFAFVLHNPALAIIGPVVGILGQTGDLVESFLKRYFKIKDSGTFIPGHGGALDRFDSMLYTAPVVYLLFRWIGY
jgi:phosphatidate cytidylyltransferase